MGIAPKQRGDVIGTSTSLYCKHARVRDVVLCLLRKIKRLKINLFVNKLGYISEMKQILYWDQKLTMDKIEGF